MQSRNLFAHHYGGIVLVLFVAGMAAPGLEVQSELFSSYNFVSPLEYVSPDEKNGPLYNLKTLADVTCSENVSFLLEHRLRSTNPHYLFPEQMYPFINYLYGGLVCNGSGSLNLGGSTSIFRYANAFPTPWYLPTDRITPEMLSSLDGSWQLESDYAAAAASARYIVSFYDLSMNDTYADDRLRNSPPYGSQRDVDLWADASVALSVLDDFTLGAGGITKQDMNRTDSYDYYRTRFAISGSHQLNRNRIGVEWSLQERFTQSGIMKDGNYGVGLSTVISGRCIWRIKTGLFVRTGLQGEFSGRLNKIWFEAWLKKKWDNASSVDIGYFATAGVLFPRHCIHVDGKMHLLRHFGLAPAVEAYLSTIGGTSFRYYRSDAMMELFFPAGTHLEFFTGAGYRHYDRHPLFASRGRVYGGLRLW